MINQKFNTLSALGIILVVGGHSGVGFLPWFPPYSFHMPLFIFISGYFFSSPPPPLMSFLCKKGKKLLLPFLGWNAFYGILIILLTTIGLSQLSHAPLSLKSLLWDPFTGGWPFVFNGPAWFVGCLFLVQCLYQVIYRSCRGNVRYIGIFCLACYFIALGLTFHDWTHWFYDAGRAIERMLFCIIFYYLGHIYRLYGERYDSFSIYKLILLSLTNGCILAFISSRITYNVHHMTFPNEKILLPLIVSITGIWFYLQIAELLKSHIRSNDLLSYIGRHTFSIMMHHQFFFWGFNTALLGLKCSGILSLNTFDMNKYMHEIYFRISAYPPINDVLYLMAGLLGPVLCCYIYERFICKKDISIRL